MVVGVVGIVVSQVVVMVMIINKLRKEELTSVSRLLIKVAEKVYYESLKTFDIIILQNHIDATKSTHEQAQANPLLGNIKKTYQHFFVGQDICDKVDCKDK